MENKIEQLTIDWLNPCPICNNEIHLIENHHEDSTDEYLHEGDDVVCMKCGQKGVIDADGENAWVNWSDNDEE